MNGLSSSSSAADNDKHDEPDAGVKDVNIEITTQNAVALVTLNRPKALNALDDTMRAEIVRALRAFAGDPIVYATVIRSASARAFCAGGDVRELVHLAQEDIAEARAVFAREYYMNWMLECFPKPTVSLIDGFVAGSGVGLTIFGTHRVAGPGYNFAMPETAIGLFPDVGVCHVLARMPDEIGTYLALTGLTIDADDAGAVGLVTHRAEAEAFGEIVDGLSQALPVDALLDKLARPVPPVPLNDQARVFAGVERQVIRSVFGADHVGDVFARLEQLADGPADQPTGAWAADTLQVLRTRAPMSLAVTLRHIRAARHMDIRETLQADYRLARVFLSEPDFAEGVRAMLIDKDKAPRWRPAILDEISQAHIDRYFSDADADANRDILQLPHRADMQRLRT